MVRRTGCSVNGRVLAWPLEAGMRSLNFPYVTKCSKTDNSYMNMLLKSSLNTTNVYQHLSMLHLAFAENHTIKRHPWLQGDSVPGRWVSWRQAMSVAATDVGHLPSRPMTPEE